MQITKISNGVKKYLFFKKVKSSAGFTLPGLILSIAILGVLAAGVFVVINPAKRIGQANDTRRWEDITAIARAIELYGIDNGSIPSEFSTSTVKTDKKVALCDTSSTVTCGSDTYGCMVVSDTEFIGKYLPSLPIAPGKASTADTGYYITRKAGDIMAVGSCSKYGSDNIEIIAKAALPAYSVVCGDGKQQGPEACDDGNTTSEGCGNGVVESAGTYCNKWCSTIITINTNEMCDSTFDDECYDYVAHEYYFSSDYVYRDANCSGHSLCDVTCEECVSYCMPPM
ncbi:hypothetical protein K8R42_04225 [bacterium]|nr:hypothetical protein [bacterium]